MVDERVVGQPDAKAERQRPLAEVVLLAIAAAEVLLVEVARPR